MEGEGPCVWCTWNSAWYLATLNTLAIAWLYLNTETHT